MRALVECRAANPGKRQVGNCRIDLAALGATIWLLLVASAGAQTVVVVDRFDPSGSRGYSYASGQIGSVWGNWFGSGLQSIAWDPLSDASNNPASGSMKVVANAGVDQYVVFNGFFVFALSAVEYTNLTFDIRFDLSSARRTNADNSVDFGSMRVGTWATGYSQDWFYNFTVASTNTNWVHIRVPLNPGTDTNLYSITDVLIGFDHNNPSGNGRLSGTQTFWVDNIQFEGPGPVVAGGGNVNWTNTHQVIDGFGASSAWMSSMTTHDADLFFSTNNGVGLSLLRSRITPDGSTWEAGIMQMAVARGAQVWSTPWSPPVIYKDTNSVDGGNFLSNVANYKGYAAQLAGYLANMKKNYGLSLYALSIQNEPDANMTNYESCLWSAQQFHDFLPYLSAAMTASNVVSTRIMLPEDMHWQWNYASNAMNDSATSNLVGILAGHNYGSAPAPVSSFGAPCPKPIWETENYFGSDDTITNGVDLAAEIHAFMTVAEAGAYHYWWLSGSGNGSIAGNNTYAPAKRLYTMGNFSRFVRPGFLRVDVTNATAALISAYKNPLSGDFAIVAINPRTVDIQQTFQFTNCAATSVAPWMTSSSNSLSSLASVSLTNGRFAYALPAKSVVTFVGRGYGTLAPAFGPVASAVIDPGTNYCATNILTDPNRPALSWRFFLAQGPSNAVVNATNGVFAWRPLLSQGGASSTIAVAATNANVPGVGATNKFGLSVRPAAPPSLVLQSAGSGQLRMQFSGPPGFAYTVQSSTNLSSVQNWGDVFTTNAPTLPYLYYPVGGQEQARFYRVRISDL